jgi:hypothetical protein
MNLIERMEEWLSYVPVAMRETMEESITALREQENECHQKEILLDLKQERIEELEAALRKIAYMDLNSIHSDPCNIAGQALDHAEDKTDD